MRKLLPYNHAVSTCSYSTFYSPSLEATDTNIQLNRIDLLSTRIANAEGTSNATSAHQRSTKGDPVTIELNRVNNEARKDIDRQTFVRIEPIPAEQSSMDSTIPCQKAILKSSTFTVERTEVAVHPV